MPDSNGIQINSHKFLSGYSAKRMEYIQFQGIWTPSGPFGKIDWIRLCQLECTANKSSQEWAKTTFADGVDPDSEQYWSKFFPDQPYKLTTANLAEGQSEIICPGCQSQIRSSWTDYGKMRTDKKASLHCKNCSANVTVEALACGRFAKDWLESTPTDLKLAYVYNGVVQCWYEND